jgi:pimeloyl-ACP methyl ester carboxylesterase
MKIAINTKTFTKRIKGIMMIALFVIFGFILIIAGILLVLSPGKPSQILDDTGKPLKGSLSEKVFITIGGVRQGMFIRSKDTTQPVLLYLHGGMPDYFLTRKYPTCLEDCFTVAWWEQRGSGISFSADILPGTISPELMINDALEVTQYLRHRFGQEKIYLMGHSGGTFIGIQAAAMAPELFHAYIGVAQMTDQLESERLAYNYILKSYREKGNDKMLHKLEAYPVINDTPGGYLRLRDKTMHDLGIGTTHDMHSVFTGIFLRSLACREYTLSEKINMWRGKSSSGVSSLWNEMINTNMIRKVPEVKLPVYFFGGIYDYTVSYVLAKEYLKDIQAPLKGFYTFENSAHSPLFEEPDKMQLILREDVLKFKNSLADPQ